MTDGTRSPDNDPPRRGEDRNTDKDERDHAPADTPAELERRPSATASAGSQVVSARLPSALVAELNRRAEEQGVKLSEVLRAAVEYYLRREHDAVPMTLSMSYGVQLRGITPVWPLGTENRVVAEQPEPLTYVPALSDENS